MSEETSLSERGFRFLERFPWKRAFMWLIFLGLLYALRDFFDVLFFTFLFSFLFGKAVSWLTARAGKTESEGFRKGVVLGLYLILFASIGVGLYAAYPHIVAQGRVLAAKVSGFAMNEHRAPPQAEKAGTEVKLAPPGAALPGATSITTPEAPPPKAKSVWTSLRVERLLRQVMGEEEFASFKKTGIAEPTINALKSVLNEVMPSLGKRLRHFFQHLLRWILHLFLALIFSLIILVDLPHLSKSVASLGESRVGDLYKEIAPGLQAFGAILGKSFQAQALIAIANTVLTAIGIFVLGLPHPFILCAVVFACSFIPVVGVMISTIPMALLAVQTGGGMLALYVVLWVLGVHFVEAYVLNPKIVGGFMHMHAIVVLVILVVAEHSFGMWGLLLGVPVCFFLYHHFIEGDDHEIARMPIRPHLRKRQTTGA